ncbi:hypothetical protein NO758_03127 [Planktothrix agardhii]|nr:hypothetical protein PL10110_590072 [Planktothrix agardhii]CAD5960771.1 hypothetical protein NO758_03127 [Planktothrix agardhii]
MNTLAIQTDIRVKNVLIHEDAFSVELMDGRTLTTPLAWFPRLLKANPEQLNYKNGKFVAGVMGFIGKK